MNQVFSFKRYILLVKRQWAENAVIYKWGIVLMVILIPLLLWLSSTWKATERLHFGQIETFSILGIFFLYTFSGNFFESLSNRHKRMFYFSLPVSSLERILAAFTFVMVLLPILFLVIFSIFDVVFIQLFNHIQSTSEQILFIRMPSIWPYVWYFVAFVPFLTLGSLIFEKNAIYKSFLAIGIISLVLSGLTILFYRVVYPMDTLNFVDIFISVIQFNSVYVFSLISLLCWVALYFVMKKKEA